MMPAAQGRRNLPALLILAVTALIASPAARAFPRARGASAFPSRIRVEISDSHPAFRVRGMDLRIYVASSPHQNLALRTGRHLAAEPASLSEWEIGCRGGRVMMVPRGGGSKALHPLELRGPVTIQSPAGFLRMDDRLLREELILYPGAKHGCEVINELELENYLDGLVRSEFSPNWNEEAVAAQVVAARTYALYQMKQARIQGARFDVHSDEKDQMYSGTEGEHYRAARAVLRTRGLVLTVGSAAHPEPIKAFYSSTCGGETELPQNVWGKRFPGFKHRVHCPYCASSPRYHWNLEISESELRDALTRGVARDGLPGGWPKDFLKRVRRLRISGMISSFDPSGRVSKVELDFGSLKLPLAATRLRSWLGPSRFLSTAFVVELRHPFLRGTRFVFAGRGNGHGVGMCQWGAKVMAEHGKKMAAILHFYYPDAKLRKLW